MPPSSRPPLTLKTGSALPPRHSPPPSPSPSPSPSSRSLRTRPSGMTQRKRAQSVVSTRTLAQSRLQKIEEDDVKSGTSPQQYALNMPFHFSRAKHPTPPKPDHVRRQPWELMDWKGSSETLADSNRLQEEMIITEFFNVRLPRAMAIRGLSTEDVTPQHCINLAARIMGPHEIRLMSNQGSNSYTLVCPSTAKIIQFRLRELNVPVLDLARFIYGKLVPEVTYYPRFALPTYISDFLPGNPHILQPFPAGSFPLARERATVTGLAAFIAKATHFPQPLYACNPDSWTLTARDRLLRLRANETLQELDLRFYKKADDLLNRLHLLDRLPPVLTHHDLAQINVLVADDGRVTGVIDFDAAGIEAFGMCIFGLYECFLGSMVDGVWSFYNQQAPGYPGHTVREVLEMTFWNTLWATMSKELVERRDEVEEALQIAVDVGIVNRYFVEGMLDRVDLDKAVHRMSLEYARSILLGR